MKYYASGHLVISNATRRGQAKSNLEAKIASKADRWLERADETAVMELAAGVYVGQAACIDMTVRFDTAASRDDVVNSAITWINANQSSVGAGSWITTHNCGHDTPADPTCGPHTTVWSK